MRIKELDSSHHCLLENLKTFHKMETSYEEIRGYIADVLEALARDLNQQPSLVKFDHKTIPKGWLEASDLPNWKGTGHALVNIGIENLAPDAIVGSSVVDQCRAHVYSAYFHNINNETAMTEFRQKLRPPQGFVEAKERGYLFTMDLPELGVEDFCNRQELTAYFSKPLNLLVNWLTKNKESLRQTAEVAGK